MTGSKQVAELSALILAAGGSSRYGQCKQLVDINGSSLVRLAIDKLSSIFPYNRINVVVGANSEAVLHDIRDLPVTVVHNRHWQKGLATSLKAGVTGIEPDCRAVMITLCDQVLVAENHLEQLINLWINNPSKIIASEYADTLGTPAIIPVDFYPQIMALDGDTGAKSILENNTDQLIRLPIPEAEFDLDVPADLEKLKKLLHTTSCL